MRRHPADSGRDAAISRSRTRRSRSRSTATAQLRSASPREQIESALYNAYGSRQVSTIYTPNNQYWVVMELLPQFQRDISALGMLYIRRRQGELVPLSAVANMSENVGPLAVTHSGQLPSVTISFNLRPGVALGAGNGRGEAARGEMLAGDRDDQLLRNGAGVSGDASRACSPCSSRDLRHLHGARHSLRELHPPDHDSHGSAVRGVRRAAGAVSLPDGARRLRVRRADHCSSAS